MQPLAGKAALVTGASRGIGLATAIALGEAGASVALNYRSSTGDAEAGAEQIRRGGGKAILVKGDVADRAAVAQMVEQTVAEFGRLDLAVSNAAYSDRQPFYEADLDGFHRTVDVTMWGAFNLMHAATQQMLAQPRLNDNEARGAIVIVSSPHAYVAVPRSMAYNMSKAAIDHMARTAAIELAEHRIRINIVTPGWIDTPGERKFATEEQIQAAGSKLPWGRLGKPEEIARGVVFLCDPKSDYMTGGALLIDGAITLPWWASRGSGVPEKTAVLYRHVRQVRKRFLEHRHLPVFDSWPRPICFPVRSASGGRGSVLARRGTRSRVPAAPCRKCRRCANWPNLSWPTARPKHCRRSGDYARD